jgi:hypothetical protein
MKLASFAFFLLLLSAHGAGNLEEQLARPLSVFREGAQGWLGYALFAVLLLIGVLYTAALVRCRREGEAIVAGSAAGLLLTVAATPSNGPFHLFCSLVLFLLLFGFYARLLSRASNVWLAAHLAVPAALVFATRFHSYGVWQKGFVGYFVIVAAVHHHMLGRWLGKVAPPDSRLAGWPRRPRKRRRVYQLGEGQEWARRDPGRG